MKSMNGYIWGLINAFWINEENNIGNCSESTLIPQEIKQLTENAHLQMQNVQRQKGAFNIIYKIILYNLYIF